MRPSRFRLAYALLMLGCGGLASLAAGQSVAEKLERLVYYGSPAPSDVVYENQPNQSANALSVFRSALDSFPDVNERLLGMVRGDFYHSGNSQKLRLSLYALVSRVDLAAAQLTALKEIEAKLDAAEVDDGMKRQFVSGFLRVLARYPAPEHEDLALKYLASDDDLKVVNAVLALAGIGTLRAVPLVRGAIKKRREFVKGAYDFSCDSMEANYHALRRRLKLNPDPIQIPRPPEPLNMAALREQGPEEEADTEPAPAALGPWGALLIAVAVLIGLVLVRWKK